MRTFLDTNVVWYVDWLGPYIFDGDDSVLRRPKFTGAKPHQQAEWLALSDVFRWAQTANPIFIISNTVLAELSDHRRPYGWELYDWAMANDPLQGELPPSAADYGLLAALPDHALARFLPDIGDRRLLAEASFHMCDYFLTMDRRTVWRHRYQIRTALGIEVVLPSELADSLFRVGRPAAR